MDPPALGCPSVAVIGAGPAGLMAAETIAAAGVAVSVFDRMPSPGRKLLMAGRGGLNLTHAQPLWDLLARYGPARAWHLINEGRGRIAVSRFVLDASVVLTWCFPDENAALARHIASLFKRGDTAVAPAFWPHEVLNALLVGKNASASLKSWCEASSAIWQRSPLCWSSFPPELFLPGLNGSAASTA